MITINSGDEVGNDGGSKLVNTEPGTGSISIYKSIPGGGYSATPFKVIDSSTAHNERAFYLPTPHGMSWRFVMTDVAVAEYTKHQTKGF